MAWEMVRIAIELMKCEESVSGTTMAGLCSVLRAGLAVLETARYGDDHVTKIGEVEAYTRILEWFAGRWMVGKEYLEKLEGVVGL